MKFQRKKVAAALAYALGAGGLLAIAAAQAADIRVDVTGSNIKRVEQEGASPILTITGAEVQKAGFTTINEALQSISQAGFALDDRFTNGFAPGAGGLNLRNLGFNSTLILVNGRRLPTYPFAQQLGTSQGFNDLNSIPLQAIDRVDVLLDGASAVYGADAVAGVVNVILKKDYQGYEAEASYNISQEGDGQQWNVAATAGWGDLTKDKWNVLVNANYLKRDEILSNDRGFARTEDLRGRGGNDRRSSYGYPGTLVDTETGERFYPSGCGPSSQWGGSSIRSGFCRYDRPLYSGLLPETERYGVFASGQYNFSEAFQLFAEASWARNNFFSTGFPAPTSDVNTGAGMIVPAGNPYNPFPNAAELRYRFVDVGTRNVEGTSDIYRVVGGLKGTVKNWDYELAAYQSEIDSSNNNLNYVLQTTAQKYFDNGKYNFANPFANPSSVTDALRYTSTREGNSKMTAYNGKASGEIWQLPAGPLAMAIGGEFRSEELSDTPDKEAEAGNTLGASAAAAYGSRDVSSAFIEFNIPVVKNFEANLAARYDKYSGNGSWSGTSPKLSLRWQPTQQLLLRGTVGQAYRAPSLFETSSATQTSFTFGIQDPVKCPVFNEDNPNCLLDVRRIQQGNANLDPEKTNVWTAGVIFEPIPSVSLGAEYWNFDRKDEIGSISDQLLVNLFPTNPFFVQRNPDGTIASITNGPVNLNKTTTSGIDFKVDLRSPATDYGRFTASGTLTYVFDYTITTLGEDGTPVDTSLNGTWGYPRVRGTWALGWNRGPWQSTLSGYYVGAQNLEQGPPQTTPIGSYTIFNLTAAYTGFKGWTIQGQVNNLFNTDPPFVDTSTGSTGGYDYTLADPRGRFYGVLVKYSYK
jgi:iron complex outermembrane recepter protein